jgi:hypothetical protein
MAVFVPWRSDKIIWDIGGIIKHGNEPKVCENNLFHFHFVFLKTHIDCSGTAALRIVPIAIH